MNDRFNPIFVLEIRQVVRNRLVLSALCLYLVSMVATVGYFFFDRFQSGTLSIENNSGGMLSTWILTVMFHYSLAVVTLYTVAMAVEQGMHQELIFQADTTPVSMMWGKVQVSLLLMSLFYAATMPFLTLAWLLRGVDILALLFAVAALFVIGQTINYYFAGVFFRCRSILEVCSAASGLIVASLPLLFFWCQWILVVDEPYAGFWVLCAWIPLGLVLRALGKNMFEENWRRYASIGMRAVSAGMFVWLFAIVALVAAISLTIFIIPIIYLAVEFCRVVARLFSIVFI